MDEESLIKNAAAGNEDAFRMIVEKYQTIVFAICLNVLKDKSEAENAAQETFLMVYRSLSKYEFKGFKTWISRIAINKSIDLKRKLTPLKDTKIISLNEVEEFIKSNECSMQDKLIKNEERAEVQNIINDLPGIYGEIIKDYYQENLSYENIATKHGISKKTVESRLYRAKKMMREKWKEEA